MTYAQGAAGNAPCGHDTIPNRLTREGFRAAEQALRRGDCPLAAECLSFARLFIKVDASERLGPDDLSALHTLLDEERKLDVFWDPVVDGPATASTAAAGGLGTPAQVGTSHVFATLQPWCIDVSPGLQAQRSRVGDVLRLLRGALLGRSPALSELLHALHFCGASGLGQRDLFPLPLSTAGVCPPDCRP